MCRGTVRDPGTTWVLSTDADSVVPPDWVDRHLAHARRGAVAVAGVVDLVDDADGRGIRSPWWADYGSTLHPDRTHPHVHAANLGVRLDVYDDVSGFAIDEQVEDIGLWDRLRAAGHQPIADSSIVVWTSARVDGRVVVGGFAGALNALYRTRS
jgi:hypothetical protein